ncbi:MAG: 1-deoxy-D-xylulose-5-phosphate reductoisomerase [Tannerellaceae bacterium]|jgi:1-deoxy-D-xylulose-5-phosphate reductoisomerase|nr:1-deoxy-D-xylulose-5-phosphate reductoisomerase [Tannerellaceae bacterium]
MKQSLAILGSTGSIGTQTLDVVAEQRDLYDVYALTANEQVDLLAQQARMFLPEVVVIANERKYKALSEALADLPIKVWAGAEAIAQVAEAGPVDTVVAAMVGYAGLAPVIAAIKKGKAIALANKETLVVAGELISALADEYKAKILPVDSEHSAIFQCLAGNWGQKVEKIWLTASGGPFRTYSREALAKVTKEEALRHPNWNMGAKITIDSASMMNKGFEMIEAKWLFRISPERIQVLVHPQSVIHSMVEFIDGAIIAQLGAPDMRMPISYALSFPTRIKNNAAKLDFAQYATLTFEQPDMEKFHNLSLAYEAVNRGGNMPCILNAANEVAVDAFLHDRAGFLQMSEVIEHTMQRTSFVSTPRHGDYTATDAEARRIAWEKIDLLNK